MKDNIKYICEKCNEECKVIIEERKEVRLIDYPPVSNKEYWAVSECCRNNFNEI